MGMKSSVIKGLGGAAALIPFWKNDTPGDPYLDGDVVTVVHNSIVFIISDVNSTNPVTINLPSITPESVSQRVEVINMLGLEGYKEEPGPVIIKLGSPDDWMEFMPEEEGPYGFVPVWDISQTVSKAHFWLISDGVHRWSFYFPAAGGSWMFSMDEPWQA